MLKSDSLLIRKEMFLHSCRENNDEATWALLRQWSVRDLYELIEAVCVNYIDKELAEVQFDMIFVIMNEKAQKIYDAISEAIASLRSIINYQLDTYKDHSHEQVIVIIKMIIKLRNKLPKQCIDDINKQDEEFRRFWRNDMPVLKKRYGLK